MISTETKRREALLLRRQAEATLTARIPVRTSLPVEALMHELQVHQIELEMQSEALHLAQSALELTRDRFVDLYDFAPVGYLTLDAHGVIEQVNLAAAGLVGMERKDLLLQRFLTRVTTQDQLRWAEFFMHLKAGTEKVSLELMIKRGDGSVFPALLDCERHCAPTMSMDVPAAPEGAETGSPVFFRIVLTDISRRKGAENLTKQASDELRRFNHAMIGREIAMIALKRQVNALSAELGRAPPFELNFAGVPDAADRTAPPPSSVTRSTRS